MNEIVAISAVSDIAATKAETAVQTAIAPRSELAGSADTGASFSSLIAEQLSRVDAKVAHADTMVTRFALDDSVPVHQVTFALEEARLSIEIAAQVRQRFVEGYRELMNMQL